MALGMRGLLFLLALRGLSPTMIDACGDEEIFIRIQARKKARS